MPRATQGVRVHLFDEHCGHRTRKYVLPLAHAHLGDVLCTTPIPRKLRERGISVYITNHPITAAVFKNNPYVAGFVSGRRTQPRWKLTSNGHMLQRVLRWYGLSVDINPKPEVYLDKTEMTWASKERAKWPKNRPVCILSRGATTDKKHLAMVDWVSVAQVLATRYTVVQPTLSDKVIPGCIVYPKLSTRQYMSLFSVADCFFGGMAGGSHVAAALDVPAIIVIWKSLCRKMRFPAPRKSTKAAFLYPQHRFVLAEGTHRNNIPEASLE